MTKAFDFVFQEIHPTPDVTQYKLSHESDVVPPSLAAAGVTQEIWQATWTRMNKMWQSQGSVQYEIAAAAAGIVTQAMADVTEKHMDTMENIPGIAWCLCCCCICCCMPCWLKCKMRSALRGPEMQRLQAESERKTQENRTQWDTFCENQNDLYNPFGINATLVCRKKDRKNGLRLGLRFSSKTGFAALAGAAERAAPALTALQKLNREECDSSNTDASSPSNEAPPALKMSRDEPADRSHAELATATGSEEATVEGVHESGNSCEETAGPGHGSVNAQTEDQP